MYVDEKEILQTKPIFEAFFLVIEDFRVREAMGRSVVHLLRLF